MTSRISFSRAADGSFSFGESRLAGLVERLYADNQEPRIPASLMSAASRELVAAIHKACAAHRTDFVKAAGLLVRERPALFRLTRARAVPDSDATADVEIER